MIAEILTFRPIDICLIGMFILFAVSIITGILIINVDQIRRWACRKLILWADRLQEWKAFMQDEIPYEPWMDYDKYMEARRP